ncbi:hypothetical protein [Olivibacter sp. XZL3]|uniref:hypothetical protein n=1 Tax=Olivibacter sp. XZL3 TaxID=1735116 RepID=UPI001064E067|nr:hypothetical protein [Olivibacter sp. XZL3]
MEIKKTISQIALGLAVIGFGAGASAFTTEKVATHNQATRFWYNDQATGQYIELDEAPDIEGSCRNSAPQSCVVQSDNTALPSNMPYTQATPANGVSSHPASNNAFYQQ